MSETFVSKLVRMPHVTRVKGQECEEAEGEREDFSVPAHATSEMYSLEGTSCLS